MKKLKTITLPKGFRVKETKGNEIILEEIEPEGKAWKPEMGEVYWFVRSTNTPSWSCWSGDVADRYSWARSNCYKTQAEAEEAAKVLKEKEDALTTVLTYIRENFGDFVPDWANEYQDKWSFYYDYGEDEFDVNYNSNYQEAITLPYLETREQCEELISKFDKELKIIFGIN